MKTPLGCARGTATVEAVVMLPLLIVLIAGALHLYRLGRAHQLSASRARACAYAHALAGCPSSPPAVCGADAGQAGNAGGGGRGELEGVDGYDDFTSNLGFLQSVVEGFLGESFSVRRSAKVPALMSSDREVEVDASHVLLCNPTPPSFGGFLRDIFGAKENIAEGQ